MTRADFLLVKMHSPKHVAHSKKYEIWKFLPKNFF